MSKEKASWTRVFVFEEHSMYGQFNWAKKKEKETLEKNPDSEKEIK